MASSPMDALGQVLSGLGEQFYQYSKFRATQDADAAQHQSDKDWQANQNALALQNQSGKDWQANQNALAQQNQKDISGMNRDYIMERTDAAEKRQLEHERYLSEQENKKAGDAKKTANFLNNKAKGLLSLCQSPLPDSTMQELSVQAATLFPKEDAGNMAQRKIWVTKEAVKQQQERNKPYTYELNRTIQALDYIAEKERVFPDGEDEKSMTATVNQASNIISGGVVGFIAQKNTGGNPTPKTPAALQNSNEEEIDPETLKKALESYFNQYENTASPVGGD